MSSPSEARARQRLHPRHVAARRRHESACVHVRLRRALFHFQMQRAREGAAKTVLVHGERSRQSARLIRDWNYGLAACPVIKVATRSDLARRWHDLMDINAGRIADGDASIEDVGWEMFKLMLDVASGRKKTFAEQWKLHNALVLFNPAPIT